MLPVQECKHVLAYESQGATNTSYGSNSKNFNFMALAEKFVDNKRKFEVVALTPFVVITSRIVVLLLVVSSNWTKTINVFLLTQPAMCSGDFV